MKIQKQNPLYLISMQQQSERQLNKTKSQELDYPSDMEKDRDSDNDNQIIYKRQLSYLEQNSQLQKTNFSDINIIEQNMNTIQKILK
ncbi:unnamed protein product [Paramecium sonneborni]|uniref:Uncharacterized protein n=1 Tax=Paramecium sonneborni TaxID=65129 RepID=A0A8S1KLI5_9CILI|nr:unnamed protein product [Paramecium sonneborni]